MSSKPDRLGGNRSGNRRSDAIHRNCPALQHIRKHRLGTYVAKQLGLNSRATVSMWTRVPAEHVIKVGKLLRMSRHRIRPDLYPAN